MELPLDVIESIVSEDEARELTYCVGCGDAKHIGLVVCWDCFKGNRDSLKYFHGEFEEWQARILKEVA